MLRIKRRGCMGNLMRKVLFTTLIFCLAAIAFAGLPTTLDDFFLPGSQPNESGNLETPNKCDNCHGGYDIKVEPAFTWRGSMMSQAARDPLYFANLAIANQDAAESGDLCIRCHSPAGWLEGRSTPTDGSALNSNDRQGVQCDFCHKLVIPSNPIENRFPNDTAYTNNTYEQDSIYLSGLSAIPVSSGNGSYVADDDNAKRGPFNDANATHQMFYSPFHSSSEVCATCHDVSNPAFSKDAEGNYVPNDLDQPSPSFDKYDMFPVERTYSEWEYSSYNTPAGVYAPQFGGNKDTVWSCQDCHMRDVTGYGCNKSGVLLRDNLPLHDMTGGNTFIPNLVDAVYPGEADLEALDSGIVRARYMLQNAASLDLSAVVDGTNYLATVRVTNETGHKLPSGYPEGRRIWLNVRAFNGNDDIIYESGKYLESTGELIHDGDIKIYEIKPGMTDNVAATLGYEPGPSFHFVTNNKIFSDNRIPPRGFTNANYEMIQSPPIGYSYADGQYWDDTEYLLPGATARIDVYLNYQTTSKEFVEFLRDENVTNEWGNTIYNLWCNNGKSAPEEMQFASLSVTPIGVNEPPVLDPIGAEETTENVSLNFTVSATDAESLPVLSASGLPEGAIFTNNSDGTGSFEWTPTYLQSGTYDVTFVATDDDSATDRETVTITVLEAGNQLPVLDPIGDKSIDENENLGFAVSAADAESIPTLSVTGLPEGASFTNNGDGTGSFEWTPTYLQSGTYDVTFVATDDSSATASELITITVNNVNRAPVMGALSDTTARVDSLIEITVVATDPDDDVVSFDFSNLPTDASFEDLGWDDALSEYQGLFSWTPGADQAGTYPDITFTCTDGSLGDQQVITIIVTEESYICGDVNGDQSVNLLDILFLIDYKFKNGPAPDPIEAADVNGDLKVDLLDILYLIDYKFKQGPALNCP